MNDIERARSALYHLDPSCSRDEWVRLGMAAKSASLSFEDFHDWSKNAGNYVGERDCKNVWKSLNESGAITAATLFRYARDNGWIDSNNSLVAENGNRFYAVNSNVKVPNKVQIKSQSLSAYEVWERCLPAEPEHEYILRKQGKPDGVRYYPSTELPLIINGKNVANYLAVPCWSNNEIQTIQFIPPSEGGKLNLPGASFKDSYFVVGSITDVIYICEGLGHAWAINKSLGAASVVCFSFGRMMTVAAALRKKHNKANLIVVSDRGKEKQAAEIAIVINGTWIKLPDEKPDNYDVNDYMLEHGPHALSELLTRPIFEMPLSVVFADELPEIFSPPDELIEGVLTSNDGSILYGDSNSGKTFFVIDLACAIARGVDWMGRKTERGLVIYLAAESPASVRVRLQAYQSHHKVRVMNFAIVQSPIDLFSGDADTNLVIQVVHLLEKYYGQKARLIVGDTLARLSAGANENAGQDMGLVVRRFDRIRNECKAHFMLIHHSGKNAAAGARGWSGVRAAVDTEIEVTDSASGRCAEITKQRDLATKGVRIGFRLDTVTLGLTKWKSSATSCVVVSTDAPPKNIGKRLSEVGGAIAEYLRISDKPIKKRDLVKHFEGRYTSSAVYRELKKLVEAGAARDYMGSVSVSN